MLINKDRSSQKTLSWRDLSDDAVGKLLKERGSLVLGRILVFSGIVFVLALFSHGGRQFLE